MAIKLNREGVALNGEERNKRNQNWMAIEEGFTGIGAQIKNVIDEAGEAAFDKVIDASKLEWQEPVATFADLATTYPDATEAFTSQTTSDGSVYRFNGAEWKKIQQVDAGPINEVDTRLTAQLAEKVGGQVKIKPEEFSDEAMALVTGNGTVNVLSEPQAGSVTREKLDSRLSGLNTMRTVVDRNLGEIIKIREMDGNLEVSSYTFEYNADGTVRNVFEQYGDKIIATRLYYDAAGDFVQSSNSVSGGVN